MREREAEERGRERKRGREIDREKGGAERDCRSEGESNKQRDGR